MSTRLNLKFDHVHIKCCNIRETKGFYERVFDAEKVYEGSIRDVPFVMLRIGRGFINLSGLGEDERDFRETGDERTKVWNHLGLGHFGIQVEDLEDAVKVLKERGVEFVWEPREVREGVKVAFIKAPEGDVVEILEREQK